MTERLVWVAAPVFAAFLVGSALLQKPSAAAVLALLPLLAVLGARASAGTASLHVSDRLKAQVAWVALLVTAVPWSSTSISTLGAVQTSTGTGKGKAVALILGLGLAWQARIRTRWPLVVNLLLVYVGTATFGAIMFPGADGADLIRSVRYVMLVVAAGWVATRLELRDLLTLLANVCLALSAVALFGHFSGLNPYDDNSRLVGWWPPLQANELGTVASFAGLAATARWATREWSGRRSGLYVAISGMTLLLTGSRTGIAAVCVGILLIVLFRWNARTALVLWAGVTTIVVLFAVQVETSSRPLHSLATRGGTSHVNSTLTGRTYGWHSVLHSRRSLTRKIVGKGLSAKTVPVNLAVTGIYGYETGSVNVDGAWFAGYLEGGLVGVLALLAAMAAALVAIVKTRAPAAIAIAVFVLIASFLNDTLNDASISLVVLVGLAVASSRRVETHAPSHARVRAVG